MTHSGPLQWRLPKEEQQKLLERFPPSYSNVVADHVTFESGGREAPPAVDRGRVVGVADDGQGVEALVVEIAGTTHRPDGSTYHITWSLDRARGREAVHSNDVIARCGWRDVPPVEVTLRPQGFGA